MGPAVQSNDIMQSTITPIPTAAPLDIEHVPVKNDPRAWSSARKNISLVLISSASMIAGLAGNIQNPAVMQMETDLHATSSQFSLSISVFILVQGLMPIVWSSISEIKGRKLVYLVSLLLFTVGSIVVAVSNSIKLVIGFRALQAAGSSAVISIGAATLADIYEPKERGTKMGIYYIAPLLGPSAGPILGGVLTTGLGWHAIFWFLAIVSGIICFCFLLFFHDTFRQERSLTYQNILRQRMREVGSNSTLTDSQAEEHKPPFPERPEDIDPEKQCASLAKPTLPVITLSLRDVNPFKPLALVLRRWNNITILFASGLLFAFAYLIAYTSARTLSSEYHYNALKVGLVSLSFGLGSVAGSILGGRWSDHELARLKAANGNTGYPEMRLKSPIYSILLFPPCVLGFGWACQQHVHIYVICVMLFLCGFLSISIYASTLAYISDANVGRSASAFATNSAFRGMSAFIATEIAVPLQDGLGDGWTYTIWAGLMLISGLLILLVAWRGERWRKNAEAREAACTEKQAAPTHQQGE